MKISLLQWNIWFKEDIDSIINDIKRINPDIVTIQELSINDNNKININKLKDVYPYVYYEISHAFENRSQCNAILSKYDFIKEKSKYIQKPTTDTTDYSKEGRIYLEVEIDVNGKKLTVGTTHLSYTHKFEETKTKDLEMNKLISLISKHKNNYIFTGDLNAKAESKYIKQISKYFIKQETGNTWTTKPFSYNGFEEDKLNWKLDYIFTTEDIRVINTTVIDTKYSDHLPIYLEINL